MLKIHFGCGSNILEGWENVDLNVDIRNPLPYQDSSVDYIFCEHLIEHVTHQEAFKFLQECSRILKTGGILRIAFPDTCRIWRFENDRYRQWLKEKGYGPAIYNILFNHGHQAMWSAELMRIVLQAIGFDTAVKTIRNSGDLNLTGLEGHGNEIGEEFNEIETSIIEGIKKGNLC